MRVVVLRHSYRKKIKSPRHAPFAKLTFKGKIAALKAGKLLSEGFKKADVITSNVHRCYQTGRLMNLFIRGKVIRESINALPSLGYVVESEYLFWNENYNLPSRDSPYYERFAAWRRMGCIKYSLKEFVHEFIEWMRKMQKNTVIITHDSHIAPILEHMSIKYSLPYRKEFTFPNPLSGYEIEFNGRKEIKEINLVKISKKIVRENILPNL